MNWLIYNYLESCMDMKVDIDSRQKSVLLSLHIIMSFITVIMINFYHDLS